MKVKMRTLAKSFTQCNHSLREPAVPSLLLEQTLQSGVTYATHVATNRTENLKKMILIPCRRIGSCFDIPPSGVSDTALVLINLFVLSRTCFLSATAGCPRNTT